MRYKVLYLICFYFTINSCSVDERRKNVFYENGDLKKEFKVISEDSVLVYDYDAKGFVLSIYYIVDGNVEGERKVYRRGTTILKGKIYYKDSKVNKMIIYDREGVIIKEVIYECN